MSPRLRALTACLAIAIAAGACGPQTARVDLPPVAPAGSNDRHVGMFVWHDLVTPDVAAAKAFYGALFGWEFEDLAAEEPSYAVIRHQGDLVGGIAGVGADAPAAENSRWISLMSVEDVDDAVRQVREAGGTVNVEPWTNPGRGRMAVVTDPQGAVVAFIRTVGGDPADRVADDVRSGRWLWTELWARDAAAAASLYQGIAGYGVESTQLAQVADYRVLTRDGRPRAGLNELPWPEVVPNWLPYIKVDDPAAVARRVEELGGTVLIPPMDRIRNGTLGLVLDPTGAAFAIQRWPVAEDDELEVPGLGGGR